MGTFTSIISPLPRPRLSATTGISGKKSMSLAVSTARASKIVRCESSSSPPSPQRSSIKISVFLLI